jgi:hypothetical protein
MSSWILPDELITCILEYIVDKCFDCRPLGYNARKIVVKCKYIDACRNYISALDIDCDPQFKELIEEAGSVEKHKTNILTYIFKNDIWRVFSIVLNKFPKELPVIILNDYGIIHSNCLRILCEHDVDSTRLFVEPRKFRYTLAVASNRNTLDKMLTCDTIIKYKLMDQIEYLICSLIINQKIPESHILGIIRKYSIPCYIRWIQIDVFQYAECKESNLLIHRKKIIEYMLEHTESYSEKSAIFVEVSGHVNRRNIDTLCDIIRRYNIDELLWPAEYKDEIRKKLNI